MGEKHFKEFNIICFKDNNNKIIDPDYIELFYEDDKFSFYEVSCHQKIKEVFPVLIKNK